MFKLASSLLLAGIALAPFAATHKPVVNATMASSELSAQSLYRVANKAGDKCTLMLNRLDTTGSLMASPQADCASLDTRIDSVRKWNENPDGSVSLMDFSEREVMRLQVSGPAAFLSTDPDDMKLSFTRAD